MQYFLLIISILFAYVACVAICRLVFHPLAAVPGPKLAALTSWYELYYDCWRDGGGLWEFKIRELHDRYGPCIRISPWEVHINGQADQAFWHVLYSNTNKLDKDTWYYDGFGAGLSAVSTGPAELHRARRASMSGYFSMANIRSYEPRVLECIAKLCERMEERKQLGQPINLHDAFRCLANDVVSSFVLPEPHQMLESPDLGKGFAASFKNFAVLITYQRHFKIVFPLLNSLPDWVMLAMDTDGSGLDIVEMQRGYQEAARLAITRNGKPTDGRPPSILDALVSSREIDTRDKQHARIVEEARNVVGAGTETTAAALTALTYHVLASSEILAKLKAELHAAFPDPDTRLTTKIAEKLPYLQACISETLRLHSAVTCRLPRVNPRASTTYTTPSGITYTFPPGTVTSMSMPDLHLNHSIFPSPNSFQPERWLESPPEVKAKMERSFVPFGSGSRVCLGMELAKMEMLLTVAELFRTFEMRLFETDDRDVARVKDWFVPVIEDGRQGLRVTFRSDNNRPLVSSVGSR